MYLLNPVYIVRNPFKMQAVPFQTSRWRSARKYMWLCFIKHLEFSFNFICIIAWWNICECVWYETFIIYFQCFSNSSRKEEKLLQTNDLNDQHNSNEDTLGLKLLCFQSCNAQLNYTSLMKPKTAAGVCIWSVNNSDVWFRSICWNEIDFRYSFGIQTINPPDHKPNSNHYLLLW